MTQDVQSGFLDSFANIDQRLNGAVELISHPDESKKYPCVKFAQGRYSGMIVAFGRVTLSVAEADALGLSYEIEIVDAAGHNVDASCEEYIGEFLSYCIVCSLPEGPSEDWASYTIA